MATPNEIRERWTQMTPEEFALIKREDLRKDVLGLYEVELNRRRSLGHYDTQVPVDSSDSIPMASLGDRLAGKLLDSLVQVGVLLLVVFIGSILNIRTEKSGYFEVTIAFVLPLVYGLIADGLGEGQSFGKRIMKTAVVDASTHMPCTIWKSIIRNGTQFLLGAIDLVFIFGERRQRLGDRVAKTIVLKIGTSQVSW